MGLLVVLGLGAGVFLLVRSLTPTTWVRRAKCERLDACIAACNEQDGHACSRAADKLDDGEGVPRDRARAIELAKRGCDLGSGWACRGQATRVSGRTSGPAADEADAHLARAFAAFKVGCENRNLDDCLSLAYAYHGGEDTYGALGKAFGKDEAKAKELIARITSAFVAGCDSGSADDCYSASKLVVGLDPTDGNRAQRVEFLEKACRVGGDRHCSNLAMVARDLGRSDWRMFFDRACAAPESTDCWDPTTKKQTAAGIERLLSRCAQGFRDACRQIYWFDQVDDKADEMRSKAEKAVDRATWHGILREECARGMSDSCGELSVAIEVSKPTGALTLELARLREQACRLGDDISCFYSLLEPLLQGVDDLYPGAFQSCARLKSGEVVCWGSGSDGQIGAYDERGTWGAPRLPEPRSVKVDPSWHESVGWLRLPSPPRSMAFTLYATYVLDEQGTVRCWGKPCNQPGGAVEALPTRSTAIVGARDSGTLCAVADKKATCVGFASRGALHLGATDVRGLFLGSDDTVYVVSDMGVVVGRLRDRRPPEPALEDTYSLSIPVEGDVEMGDFGACVLRDGRVSCAGAEVLARGPAGADAWSRYAQPIPGVEGAVEITLQDHHACARQGDGRVACWTLPAKDVTFIEGIAKATHLRGMCAVAEDGFAWCWPRRGDHPFGAARVLKLRGDDAHPY